MHGSFQKRLVWIPALIAMLGLCSSALAQEATYAPATETAYAYADVSPAPMMEATPNEGYFNNVADDGDLNKRIAALEGALKKIDDKAKEDKKKAASKMSVNPGGQFFLDGANYSQDAVDKTRTVERNGAEFRQIRLNVTGNGFDVISYKIEVDFANNVVVAKDVYGNIGELPLIQNVQIGHFKEPFSLDELTSDKYITFMERSTADYLTPQRHIGVMAWGYSESERATYAVGGFMERGEANINQATTGENVGHSVTMRGTYLPWYDEATEGRGLWHIGGAYSYRDPYMDTYYMGTSSSIAFRPESHLAYNNTLGSITDLRDRQLVGAETAFVYGPFSIQSEYIMTELNRTRAVDSQIQGGYVYMSYFLTGEHRPYNRKNGTFDRVKPYENFFRVRDENGCIYTGKGAWELKYRYSYTDFRDGGALRNTTYGLTTVETVSDHTLGVNWYLNPYTRMMFEYINSGINRYTGLGAGDLDIYQVRAQFEF